MPITFYNLLANRTTKKGNVTFFVRACLDQKEKYEVEVSIGNKIIYSKSNHVSSSVTKLAEEYFNNVINKNKRSDP